jgi:electron transfer flavoprotein alpha subunit
MAFRKNYRKTKKRGGEEGANAVDKETRKYWKNYVNDILEKLESNQITFNIQELNDLIDIAIRYNVGEDLISRVAARGDRTTKRKFFDYEMSEEAKRSAAAKALAAAKKGGGKRRNTRRHKKKANQTHHKKHRRNSRKKHNTRRKYKL